MKSHWASGKKLIYSQGVDPHEENHGQISSQQTHLLGLLLPTFPFVKEIIVSCNQKP